MSTKKKVLLGAAFVATLFVGVGIGANGSEPVAAPTPTPTRTYKPEVLAPKTVEVPVPGPTVTETIKAPTGVIVRAPGVCIDALDDAEKVTAISAQAFNITSQILMAASNFDVAGMEAGNAQLDSLKPQMDAAVSEYNNSSNSCRKQR